MLARGGAREWGREGKGREGKGREGKGREVCVYRSVIDSAGGPDDMISSSESSESGSPEGWLLANCHPYFVFLYAVWGFRSRCKGCVYTPVSTKSSES